MLGPGRALGIYGQTLNQLKWAILPIASILGLAYLLNYSGVTYTLGLAFAATGLLFPFFASFIGWLGVAITGSDTSSNALFANLQKVTAQQIGVSPVLPVGANSPGGVLGKMISPQNQAVGTSATGLQGKEGDLLRLVLNWYLRALRRGRREPFANRFRRARSSRRRSGARGSLWWRR